MSKSHRWLTSLGFLLAVLPLSAAPRQSAPQSPAPQVPQRGASPNAAREEGIPVLSAEVQKACGSCHTVDDKKMMTRISYRRASPENWELTIRRMVSLNNVNLTVESARSIIKYLADNNGLAPEEARAASFEAERRMIDYTYAADKNTADTCSQCHSMGRVISERRTSEEWGLLLAMHRGYYPEAAAFRARGGGPGGASADGGGQGGAPAPASADSGGAQGGAPAPADGGRQGGAPAAGGRGGGGGGASAADRARDHLARAFPLQTPEWASWSAAMRSPKIAGRWALSGYEAGKGPVYGEVTISEQPGSPDAFLTDTRFVYARTGQAVTRKSRVLVYTGFQWRGRSADAVSEETTWREVAFIGRDWREIEGRWFTGAYDEIGMDVTLRRVANDPVVLGTNVASLKRSTTGRAVRIYGANFPRTLATADIDFGQGVTVSRISSVAPEMVTVDVDVAPDARVGPRDLWLAGAAKPAALIVYDKIDGIKVLPEAGMARVGGVVFPRQLQQFEAIAMNYGADGKPDTKDDFNLGLVDVGWGLEEYTATFRDDDLQFVGELNASGLFIPNLDGPNPQRSGNRNNVGDVWAVATYTPDGSVKPLRARAHLLVTVPLYLRWDPKEIAR